MNFSKIWLQLTHKNILSKPRYFLGEEKNAIAFCTQSRNLHIHEP